MPTKICALHLSVPLSYLVMSSGIANYCGREAIESSGLLTDIIDKLFVADRSRYRSNHSEQFLAYTIVIGTILAAGVLVSVPPLRYHAFYREHNIPQSIPTPTRVLYHIALYGIPAEPHMER